MNDWLDPLRRVLDQSPRQVRFFFHDDSDGSDSPRLPAMLDVFASHRIPIDLAVNAHPRGNSFDEDCPAPLHTGCEPICDLVRRIAAAAASHQRIGIVLDHSLITCDDLRLLDELLTLVGSHRRAECPSIQRDCAAIGATDEVPFRAFGPGLQDSHVGPLEQRPARLPTPRLFRRWLDAVNGRRARRGLAWAAACVAVLGTIGAYWNAGPAPETQLLTATVARGRIENTVLAAGVLQPFEFVDVGAQVSGQLKRLYVRLGDRVRKGQLLAEIDPVISASRVVEAEATLANLRAQWDARKEQLELARLQKARSDELLRQGATAASDSEIADSNYKVGHAELAALGAQIKEARAALQTARANLSYTRISAPMAGEVVSISARTGQTLNANQQAPIILRIGEVQTMTVAALVPEADVSRLKIGQEVYFTVLGQGERRWYGRLRQILPSPEIISNVVFYNALFDVQNPQRELKIQMTAQVFFVLEQASNALYVP
jgi:macrolide-specific efflux system membrane fusion protein